jgi:four helix bundle protein
MVPYERFDAWKIAHQLALDVYTVTDSWPANEKYGLIAQIRRAAISAPTNLPKVPQSEDRESFAVIWISH